MKRLIVVIGGLLALPAFAEVAPFYYDGITEYADTEMVDDGVVVGDEIVAEKDAASAPVARTNASSRMASRVAPAGALISSGRSSSSRSVASRGAATARTTTNSARTVSSRVAGTGTTGTVAARRGTVASNPATVARAGTTTTTVKSIGGTVNTSQDSLYLPNSTGRVGVRSAGSAVRAPSISVSSTSTTTTTAASAADATSSMDTLAELTDYCKAQYTACMDNFCNVLDDNQGRCSCSKNLKNYEKTETALKNATEELQEVAQKIQYIGLSADEITTLFTQTEAELAMQNNSDSTKLTNDLERIKNMIVDVKTGTASTIGDSSGISLDLSNLLSFNISSTGFDLSALFGTTSSNTSSVSNQRGETLYKTAAARCKASVLNNCTAQGVDAAVITNSYDLEIDKQCIAYERALTDSNSQMTSTVRNAKTVLQKARLMVAQQKNQYDLRGCISALDSCMQDDYVCGTDYEYCLDPSGKYVSEGEIIVGSLPGKPTRNVDATSGGLYATWVNGTGSNTSTPWDTESENANNSVATYITNTLTANPVTTIKSGMSEFLQYKIGYNSGSKNYGMCMSVLNKCQDYTYLKGNYVNDNRVITEYLYRTLPRIKAAQDALLTNYASNCIADVTSCLSTNNYSVDGSAASQNIALNACKSVITTCMSVNGGIESSPSSAQLTAWAKYVYGGADVTAEDSVKIQNYTYCVTNGGTWSESGTYGSCTCKSGTGTWTADDTGIGSCVQTQGS